MRLQPSGAASDTYDLLIYGDIGESWWSESVTAKSVVEQLNTLDGAVHTLNVRINSYGGSVADGLAIYNALTRHGATKIVTVDGVAMSSASLIAMAGDEVHMPATSLLMIHAPWGGVNGNAKEMRQYADVLDKFSEAMADAYVAKSGMDRADVLALLTDGADHYYTGEEAVDAGFADAVVEHEDLEEEASENARAFASALLQRISDGRGAPSRYAGLAISAALRGLPMNTVPKEDFSMRNRTTGDSSAPRTSNPEFQAAIRDRNQQIQAAARPFLSRAGVQDLMVDALADPAITPEAFSQSMLTLLGQEAAPIGASFSTDAQSRRDWTSGHVTGGRPAGDDFVLAVSDSLLVRAGFRVENQHAGARDVMGMNLQDIIRACVNRGGRQHAWATGDSRNSAIRAALSTSDFPAILENTLNKALRAGYESEPASFTAWTRHVRVKDFKEQSRVLLGSAPELLRVPEGGEYTHGAMDEDKSVPYKVDKFGRIIRLTWEALVNDDLGAFLRVTQAMGQAALRTEADLVYQTFTNNAGAGPTMQDGIALFHASHGNLATAATGVTSDALGAARVLLRRQTALGGGALNLAPRYLLVAPEHEQEAEVLLATAGREVTQGASNAVVPAWVRNLELVVEARLPDDAFYLLTSPTNVDTLERAWLDEDNGPKIEEEDAFATDATSYKVRHVCGCRWLDYRGVVKTPISG